MDSVDWIQLIESASIVLASGVAAYSVSAWRREHIGRCRMELAEEVLVGFYEARDTISQMRSPLGYVGEGSERKQGPNETPEVKQARDGAYVLIARYKQHQHLFTRLQSLRYRFMGMWGANAVGPFNELNKIINELFIASQMLSELWAERARAPYVGSEPEVREETHKYRAIFYYQGPGDQIAPRVDAVVEEIEKICEPILRNPRKRWWRRPWRAD